MTRRLVPLLWALLAAAPAWAQPELREVHAHDGRDGPRVYVRGGVTGSSQPLEVWAITSQPAWGDEVRVVYSTDGFRTSRTAEATFVHGEAGPARADAAWRASLGPFADGATVEYYVESVGPNGGRRAINGHGPEGPAGENFVAYVWGKARTPAPAAVGAVIEVDLEKIHSSQGWLFRHRGRYDPGSSHWSGERLIPSVYWVSWAAEPYWALANDGNHRTFDAVRQGRSTVLVRVVEPPYHVFPARFKFLDQPVYDDADRERRQPIGRARDFHGAGAQPAQPFARRAVAEAGPVAPLRMSDESVRGVFEAVRAGALSRNLERLHAAGSEAVSARLEAARGELHGLRLELLLTNDVVAERAGGTVRLSTGLLNALVDRGQPVAERALGLILAHEAAHASGLRGESLADAEAVKILEKAGHPGVDVRGLGAVEIRAAVEAFERPVGARRVDGLFARVRDLLAHGTPEGRIARLTRAAGGAEVDGFAAWRRADGTLDWGRAARSEGAALSHFTLALFLKELAVVVQTGDRLRVEEFFDGLLTTDFYVHYGLFTVGARAGEVAYGRYLQGFIRPRFVGELLRSNVALATGMALPELVAGRLEGKAFAVSLGSLGLSSMAVKAGARGVRGLVELARPARTAGAAARAATLAGWIYTAAETAVVLYVAEELEARTRAYLDARAARKAVGDAARELLRVAREPDASEARLAAALEAHHEAWTAYRDAFYAPALVEDARLQERFERFAREAKLAADERAALLARVAGSPALRANIERRHGSLDAYARARDAEAERDLGRRIEAALDAHRRARERLMAEVYAPEEVDYLDEVEHATWVALGAPRGHALDPYAGRGDLLARLGRERARRALDDALDEPSGRLGSYEDERRVLALVAAISERHADVVADARAAVVETERLDRELVAPRDAASATSTRGLTGSLPPGE